MELEPPDGISVAPQGRRNRNSAGADAECFADLSWCDVIGHQGGDAALARELGIERAELDEPIEGITGRVAEIDGYGTLGNVSFGLVGAVRLPKATGAIHELRSPHGMKIP